MAFRVLAMDRLNFYYLIDFDELLCFPLSYSTIFERRDDKWVSSVHNFSNVAYLNLPEIKYIQPGWSYVSFRDFSAREIDNLISDLQDSFMKRINVDIIHYLLYLMERDPGSSKKMNVLLSFLRLSKFDLPFGISNLVFSNTLKTLYTYHENSDFVINLLRICYHLDDVQGGFRNWDVDVEHFKYIIEKCYEVRFDIHEFMTCEKTRKMGTTATPFCPVIDSLLDGAAPHLALFIEYGFQWKECDRLQYGKFKNLLVNISSTPIDASLLLSAQHQYRKYKGNRAHLSLDIIIILFFFISTPNKDRRCEWLRCGQLLFDSVPDPYVSWNELKSLFVGREDSKALIPRLSSARKGCFTEIIPEVYEPRNLTHLCRCVIRSALAADFQLPKGIKKLKVPNKIRKYLQLTNAD